MKLAKYFFEEFGWTIPGTYAPTDKKSRADSDFFLRLSRGAKDSVKRGWFREAVLEMKTPSGKKYYIQAKQVCFLSTNEVGFSDGMTVKRHTKKRERRDTIDAPRAQQDYSQFFNAVDRNDRDSSDYSTTIRTNRYYLRIFCWALDSVLKNLRFEPKPGRLQFWKNLSNLNLAIFNPEKPNLTWTWPFVMLEKPNLNLAMYTQT